MNIIARRRQPPYGIRFQGGREWHSSKKTGQFLVLGNLAFLLPEVRRLRLCREVYRIFTISDEIRSAVGSVVL